MEVYAARRVHRYEGEVLLGVVTSLDEAKALCVVKAEENQETVNWDWVEKKVYPDEPGTRRWEAEGPYYDWDVVEFEIP